MIWTVEIEPGCEVLETTQTTEGICELHRRVFKAAEANMLAVRVLVFDVESTPADVGQLFLGRAKDRSGETALEVL